MQKIKNIPIYTIIASLYSVSAIIKIFTNISYGIEYYLGMIFIMLFCICHEIHKK